MRNLWREKNGVFKVVPGTNVTNVIVEAITLSAKEDRPIVFEFNGVTVTVRSDSDPELIYRDWLRALNGYVDR